MILDKYDGHKIYLLAPLVKTGKAITRNCLNSSVRKDILLSELMENCVKSLLA